VRLITSCSSSFGRKFALVALARSDTMVAAARDVFKLEDCRSAAPARFQAGDDTLRAQIGRTLRDVGSRVDFLVNNAGYVLEGGLEECSDAEVRGQFDTNVFDVLDMLRAVLPRIREQRAGVVANMGSLAGWRASPFIGP
jgi:NADP-dependent 3-hydroxy acid dehydrogenase YdfG